MAGALFGCTEPRFSAPDGSSDDGAIHYDGDPHDGGDEGAGADSGDLPSSELDGGLTEAGADDPRGDAQPDERAFTERLLGHYALRVYFHGIDGDIRPVTKNLSLVEIRQGTAGLTMEETLCSVSGRYHHVFFGDGATDLIATKVASAKRVFQLQLNVAGDAFETDTPTMNLGFDPVPSGCSTPGASVPTTMERYPWLRGANCICPRDAVSLPAEFTENDCRLNDGGDDDEPGVTVKGVFDQVPATYRVFMRLRDRYLQGHFDSEGELLSDFDTQNVTGLIRCEDPSLCQFGVPLLCAPEYNQAEFVRIQPGTLSCDGLIQRESDPNFFKRPPRTPCTQGVIRP